jgi:hypothetical protein
LGHDGYTYGLERGFGFFTFRGSFRFTVGVARTVSFHSRAAVADLHKGFSRGFGRPLTSPDITQHYAISDNPPRGAVAG